MQTLCFQIQRILAIEFHVDDNGLPVNGVGYVASNFHRFSLFLPCFAPVDGSMSAQYLLTPLLEIAKLGTVDVLH